MLQTVPGGTVVTSSGVTCQLLLAGGASCVQALAFGRTVCLCELIVAQWVRLFVRQVLEGLLVVWID